MGANLFASPFSLRSLRNQALRALREILQKNTNIIEKTLRFFGVHPKKKPQSGMSEMQKVLALIHGSN
jgi:hypothetical protein